MRYLHAIEEWLLCFSIAVLTGLVFLESVFRILGVSALWVEESIHWAAAWFVLFGMSYGVRVGSHIGLTVLVDKITNLKIKKLVSLLAITLAITYCIIFLISSIAYVKVQYMIGFDLNDVYLPEKSIISFYPMEEIRIKVWVLYCGLIAGFGLLLLRFAVVFYNVLLGKQAGLTHADEAKDAIHAFVEEALPEEKN